MTQILQMQKMVYNFVLTRRILKYQVYMKIYLPAHNGGNLASNQARKSGPRHGHCFSKPDERPNRGKPECPEKNPPAEVPECRSSAGPYPPACVCNINIYTHHTHHFYLQPVFSQLVSPVLP